MPEIVERAAAAYAALSVERSVLATERERAKEVVHDLEIAWTIAADKEKELEWIIRAKLDAQETTTKAKVKLETA